VALTFEVWTTSPPGTPGLTLVVVSESAVMVAQETKSENESGRIQSDWSFMASGLWV
jgi:hypothetical protein